MYIQAFLFKHITQILNNTNSTINHTFQINIHQTHTTLLEHYVLPLIDYNIVVFTRSVYVYVIIYLTEHFSKGDLCCGNKYRNTLLTRNYLATMYWTEFLILFILSIVVDDHSSLLLACYG